MLLSPCSSLLSSTRVSACQRTIGSIMHYLLLVSCSTGMAISLLLHPAYRSLEVPAGREIESRGLYVPLRGLDDGLCNAGLPIGCILLTARLNSK